MRDIESISKLREARIKINEIQNSLQEIKSVFNDNLNVMEKFYKSSELTEKDLEILGMRSISIDNFKNVIDSGVYKIYPETYENGDVLLAYMVGVNRRYPYRVISKEYSGVSKNIANLYCLGLKPLQYVTCKELNKFAEENLNSSLLYSWDCFKIFDIYKNELLDCKKIDKGMFHANTWLNTGFSYWLKCEEFNDNGEKLYSWISNGVVNYGTAEELGDVRFAVIPFSTIKIYDDVD